jgi:RNA polymerase sigma-70 factor (ECF subfamily)
MGDRQSEASTDRELVRLSLAGDPDAFATLHRRYYPRIFRLALYRCRSVADAEDIAAETFLKAITFLPNFRFQGESLLPWLSRIATNLAADQHRRLHGTVPLSLDARTADDVRTLLENLEADGPDPHQLAERTETQALIRAAIAALPADQGDAILLRFGGDLPLVEIALAMNRTEGAIKSLIHRGLVNLRKTLTQQATEAANLEQMRAGAAGQERTNERRIEL